MEPIYLDYNATTPIDPRVAEAMLPFIHQHFGNPSSSHVFGINAKKAVDKARKQIANMLKCKVDEIIFTSGGSESNNYAIKGAAFAYSEKGNHIITSSIEHPAVLEVCAYLETRGFKVTYLPVDKWGMVDMAVLEKAITPQTILISIMHANNEVGTIQPISEIAKIARDNNIIMHTDAAQSIGKISVNIEELPVDLLSIAGHKLYAPKGIGALYIRSGINLEKQIHGADHERNWRAGTENVIEIAGLGKACELIDSEDESHSKHLRKFRDYLEVGLKEMYPGLKVNGHTEKRLPNTCSVSFKGLEANTILSQLKTVAASAGAACHSGAEEASGVMKAMLVPVEFAMGTVRFSVGRFTVKEEIETALSEIKKVINSLRPKEIVDSVLAESEKIKLTQYTHGLGCACKLRPQLLEEVLKKLPVPNDKNIIIGSDTSDDAAIYRIDENTAIVQTVDFFTPIVDDPFQFGAIAAVNSLSDVYAMGAKPLFALNVVGFPSNRLPISVLEEILKGALSVAEEAGISILGGHTVDDTEPKFGMAVTGIIHPDKIISNKSAKPGDVLILTKPLGTGILSTALKQDQLTEQQSDILQKTMRALNKDAAEIMQKNRANSCTDITGFGFTGHLLEMMKASKVTAIIDYKSIPFLTGVYELAASGIIPGGTRDNFAFTQPHCQYGKHLTEIDKFLLNDAQTSGGLLISIKKSKSNNVISELKNSKSLAAVIVGEVVKQREKLIEVR